MQDSTKKQLLIGGAICAAVFILWKFRPVNQTIGEAVMPVGDMSTSGEPVNNQTWIPGGGDPSIIFGNDGQPFFVIGGDTVINVPDVLLGSLSRQFIPMFGFVGVTAVGGNY